MPSSPAAALPPPAPPAVVRLSIEDRATRKAVEGCLEDMVSRMEALVNAGSEDIGADLKRQLREEERQRLAEVKKGQREALQVTISHVATPAVQTCVCQWDLRLCKLHTCMCGMAALDGACLPLSCDAGAPCGRKSSTAWMQTGVEA